MNFHEIRFPSTVSYGATGGPERRTDIVTLASGHEERNTPWAHSRRRYDAGLGLVTVDQLEEVVAFFEARMGQLYGFRWKDWTDYKSSAPTGTPGALDQDLGVGDGTRTQFSLQKTYASGPHTYVRPITKPVTGTVVVALDGIPVVNGTDYTVQSETGVLDFAVPPGSGVIVTAGYEFDVPVRFDTDRIETSLATFSAGEIPNVPVIEVRI